MTEDTDDITPKPLNVASETVPQTIVANLQHVDLRVFQQNHF